MEGHSEIDGQTVGFVANTGPPSDGGLLATSSSAIIPARIRDLFHDSNSDVPPQCLA